MDPLQTYIEMMSEILDSNDWDAAEEHAQNLLDWLNRGGFFPGTISQRISVLNQCNQVANG